jgi:hypothetical protein
MADVAVQPAAAVRMVKQAVNATAGALYAATAFADADQSQLTAATARAHRPAKAFAGASGATNFKSASRAVRSPRLGGGSLAGMELPALWHSGLRYTKVAAVCYGTGHLRSMRI